MKKCKKKDKALFLPKKIFIIKVMLTSAFLTALAIHICKSRFKWTVRIRADQGFTLDSSILKANNIYTVSK
jgi:hypothetical protein